MIRISLSALLCLLLYVPITSSAASQETELITPVQVVAAFQKIPNNEMFCADDASRSMAPIKIGTKFESYLSKELHRLFMWEVCGVPEIPPPDESLRTGITWDIRYGSGYLGTNWKVDNIRVQPAKFQESDKAIVKLLFDTGWLKNITTTYTLIREDGHWKIDDIAPKGDFKPDDENYDTVLAYSDSIKTDMQKNYRAAEKRYQIDHPGADLENLKQVMAALLKLPRHELFCKDTNWKPAEPNKVAATLEPYLSNEFIRLYLWSQCGEPQIPPRYKNLPNELPWDIRYGVGYKPYTGGDIYLIKEEENTIVELQMQGSDKAIYQLQYRRGELSGQSSATYETTFTLIREGGRWKVDDMVLGGGARFRSRDTKATLVYSDSIKTDMQNNYRAAEERYRQEQAKKGAPPTP